MTNVIKSVRLDYYTLKSNYARFIIIYALAVLLAVFTQPVIAIVIIMAFSVFLSGLVFSIYEKNNLSRLYGILPLRRTDVVIGRFIFALCFCLINMLVSGCMAYIISSYSGKGMEQSTFITYLSASFLYYCLAIGISFPIYFKIGFSKAYIFTMLPMYIIIMGSVLISKKADLSGLKQTFQYYISHQHMIWITGCGAGLILLAVSCFVSCLITKRAELT